MVTTQTETRCGVITACPTCGCSNVACRNFQLIPNPNQKDLFLGIIDPLNFKKSNSEFNSPTTSQDGYESSFVDDRDELSANSSDSDYEASLTENSECSSS